MTKEEMVKRFLVTKGEANYEEALKQTQRLKNKSNEVF